MLSCPLLKQCQGLKEYYIQYTYGYVRDAKAANTRINRMSMD